MKGNIYFQSEESDQVFLKRFISSRQTFDIKVAENGLEVSTESLVFVEPIKSFKSSIYYRLQKIFMNDINSTLFAFKQMHFESRHSISFPFFFHQNKALDVLFDFYIQISFPFM